STVVMSMTLTPLSGPIACVFSRAAAFGRVVACSSQVTAAFAQDQAARGVWGYAHPSLSPRSDGERVSATMRFTPAWEGKVFIIAQRTDARRSVTGDDGAAEAIVEAQASDVGAQVDGVGKGIAC